MIKPTRDIAAVAAILGAAFAHDAVAQGVGSSVFSDGGGLLLEPVDPLVQAPGALNSQTNATGEGGATALNRDGGQSVDQGRGPLVTLGLSIGYVYDDEEDSPTESFLETNLTAGVFTQTRNQTFDLNFGIDLETGDLGMGTFDTELTDPSLRLDYILQNRNIRFDTDLIWREADVGNSFLPAAFDADDLVIDGGTESIHEARFRLETGRAARFGTVSRLEFRQRDFTDTIDPDLVNETRLIASTELRFTLSRQAELTTFASWTQESDDDAIETTDTDIRYGAGLDVLFDQAWSGSFEVALTDEETETTLGTTQRDGFDVTATATRFMGNGRLSFSAGLEDNGEGTLTNLDVLRALDLANGASVTAGIGVSIFEDGDLAPTVTFGYSQEILRGRTLSLSLSQVGGFDEDEAGVVRTTFNANYTHDLTRNSQIGLTGALAGLDNRGVGDDTLAASFGVRYSHNLTEDWALVARADSRVNFTDGDQTDSTNQFSINLQRTFSFRP